MKRIIILLNFLFFSSIVAGQTKITFEEYLIEQKEVAYQWTINGLTFSPTTEEIIIYPHDKGIDTIIFQSTNNSDNIDTIFSRIPYGQELIIIENRCCLSFNIIKKEDYTTLLEKYNNGEELMFGTYQGIGTVKFVILNKPISDTLICTYSPWLEEYGGQMITVDKDYGWLIPCGGPFRSDILPIDIIKINTNLDYELLEEDKDNCIEGIDIVYWNASDFEILKRFGLFLFNNEKVIIQFDYLTKEMKLLIEE